MLLIEAVGMARRVTRSAMSSRTALWMPRTGRRDIPFRLLEAPNHRFGEILMAMRNRSQVESRHAAKRFFPAFLALLITGVSALGQDNVRGGTEPIVSSIDPSKLTYDILVDGNLQRDDPANLRFKTVQAAYAAAPPGTEAKRTVIGIKPNVYLLPADQPR